MISLLLFNSSRFFKMFPYWLWSMSHHRVEGLSELTQWCGKVLQLLSLLFAAPLLHEGFMVSGRFWTSVMEFGSPESCCMEGWQGTFLPLLVICWPAILESENLAVAVHVSISIPASLQVIACFGSFWCGTLVSFEPIPLPFVWGEAFHFYRPGRFTWWLPCNRKCFSLGYVLGCVWSFLHCKCLNTCFTQFLGVVCQRRIMLTNWCLDK